MYSNQEKENRAVNIIKQAYDQYGRDLYVLSNFGANAGVLLDLVQKSGIRLRVINIDTGFLFPETQLYKLTLQNKFGFKVITYGPYKDEIEQIAFDRLWEKDIDAYNQIVKLDPLKRAIEELGVGALLQGDSLEQVDIRPDLQVNGQGIYGENRVRPLLQWKKEDIEAYLTEENIPRNLLIYEGYESIGDWTTTLPGFGLSRFQPKFAELAV